MRRRVGKKEEEKLKGGVNERVWQWDELFFASFLRPDWDLIEHLWSRFNNFLIWDVYLFIYFFSFIP